MIIAKQPLWTKIKPEALLQCILYNPRVKNCFSVLVNVCI